MKLILPSWLPPVARFIVDGDSMAPSYRAGERLLVNRLAYIARAPGPGDVVVLRDPDRPERLLLKRVVESRADWCVVQGDNGRASRDSRHFGPVRRKDVLGKVLWRY